MTLSYKSVVGGKLNVSSDFTVSLGTSGNTRIPLSTDFPSGTYTVTSTLSDSSLDVYLIGTDGTSAGYANSNSSSFSIVATKDFNAVVVLGGTNNDTLTFVFKYVFSPTENSVSDIAAVPAIIDSISTSSLPNQNNTTTVTGKNFANDVTVTFTGSDNVARSAKSITRNSSTSLSITRPDNLPTDYAPYTITVANPGIPSPTSTNQHKLSNSVTVGSAPSWVTSNVLPAYRKDEAYSQVISATDSDGGSSVTYSYVSGALPSGMSFDLTTGTFSGTPTTNASASYTYTVRVTDSGNNYVDRTFTVQQLAPDAPTVGTATDIGTNRSFNDGAATVTFTPAATGPAATSYTVVAYLDGSATGITASGNSSPITITGLSSNTNYTFLVKANNASGSSLNSSQSGSQLITTVPQAPTIGTITKNTSAIGQLSVPFTSNSNGGKAITSYTATRSGGTHSGASTPILATGLTPGTSYNFTVTATNANGTSAASSSSNTVAATQYTCPSGGSVSGTNCITSYAATYTPGSLYCSGQYGSLCYGCCGVAPWICPPQQGPDGTCQDVEYVEAWGYNRYGYGGYSEPQQSAGTYSCPSGGSVSGSNCVTTVGAAVIG